MPSPCFFVTHCFRTRSDFEGDGFLFLKDCVIGIDKEKVLCLFNSEDVMEKIWDEPLLRIPLAGKETKEISFKKIRSSGRNHTMGRVQLKGLYREGWCEKITIKMEIPVYNKIVQLVRSW